MQVLLEKEENKDTELEEFKELMIEVSKLPQEKRNIVAIYSQGVLAISNVQRGINLDKK